MARLRFSPRFSTGAPPNVGEQGVARCFLGWTPPKWRNGFPLFRTPRKEVPSRKTHPHGTQTKMGGFKTREGLKVWVTNSFPANKHVERKLLGSHLFGFHVNLQVFNHELRRDPHSPPKRLAGIH